MLGFTVTPRKSRRHPAKVITDLDFANNIALLSDTLLQAQNLLSRVERAADSVGLQMNWWLKNQIHGLQHQRRCHSGHQDREPPGTSQRLIIPWFMGWWILKKDYKIRKSLAWKACNKMLTLWKSVLPASLKISFFRAAVESTLLYGAEGWTITNKLEARLDDCYTRLPMMVLDLNWKDHPTREEIYGNLPKVSEVAR